MRRDHLDIARAVSITLVVMGHGPVGVFHPDLQQALGCIRLPLLLMLAGMHLRPDPSLWATATRKADGLLKPYLVMAVLLAVLAPLQRDQMDWAAYIAGVASFNGLQLQGWMFPMWFLTLLWAIQVASSALIGHSAPLRPLPRLMAWSMWLALLAVGYLSLPGQGPNELRCAGSGLGYTGLMFNLDLLPLGGAWFLAGYMLAQDWRELSPSWTRAIAWTSACVAILLLAHPKLDLLSREAEHPLAGAAAAMAGAWAVVSWSRLLQDWEGARRWITPIGRNSLYVLVFHAPIQSVLSHALARLSGGHDELAAWVATLIIVPVCVELGLKIQKQAWTMALFEPMSRVQSAFPATQGARPAPHPRLLA